MTPNPPLTPLNALIHSAKSTLRAQLGSIKCGHETAVEGRGIMKAKLQPSLAMSTAPADIAVFSKDRRPILVVEVKDSTAYIVPQAAADLRRNLLAHGLLADVPFFMLATAVQVFLWPKDVAPDDRPQFSAATKSVLDAYGSKRPMPEKSRRGGALEIVTFSWLSDLASEVRAPSADSDADRMILESGLYDQIKGGAADFDVRL